MPPDRGGPSRTRPSYPPGGLTVNDPRDPAAGTGPPTTVEQRSISTELARRLVDACVEQAEERSVPLTIAVVDASALLVSFLRMVGAPLATIQTAHDKAWTAVATRRATHKWSEAMDHDTPLRLGVPAGIKGVIVFGGGFPIVVDGALVGGVGISGAHHDVDRQVAMAVLQATGLDVVEACHGQD